jgi:hypothetical protein
MHNIFSVGQILTELGFKILNVITWEKTNPPPNFSCRYFTYSTEQIIWARKEPKVPHYYNYELMKQLNGDKQMKDVWRLPAIAPWEKKFGKHPTQKPLGVLTRLILASTKPGAWILDPFTGSSTTGIAANLTNRRFLGIDKEAPFLAISKKRKHEIEDNQTANLFKSKIVGFNTTTELSTFLDKEHPTETQVALGYCRAKDLKKLEKQDEFYFHAIEEDETIRGFPSGINDSKVLMIYSGGRTKPLYFTGYVASIKSIDLLHKSKIKGKENSSTQYYHVLKLDGVFRKDESLKGELKYKVLFEPSDKFNPELIKQYLPAITNMSRVLENTTN